MVPYGRLERRAAACNYARSAVPGCDHLTTTMSLTNPTMWSSRSPFTAIVHRARSRGRIAWMIVDRQGSPANQVAAFAFQTLVTRALSRVRIPIQARSDTGNEKHRHSAVFMGNSRGLGKAPTSLSVACECHHLAYQQVSLAGSKEEARTCALNSRLS